MRDTRSNSYDGFAARHRRTVLLVLVTLTALFGAAYVIINLQAGKYIIAGMELAMTVFAATLIVIVRGTRRLTEWTIAFIIPFYAVMMYGFYSPNTEVTVYSWVMVIPLLAHLLLGRRLGAVLSLFFIGCAGALFYHRFGGASLVQTPGAIANVTMATATVFALAHFYEASREQAERRLARMAMTDALTGLPNRAYFEQIFEQEKQEHVAHDLPLSLLMVDVDFFKQVNDVHGHEAGDAALRDIATAMRDNVRQGDAVGRLGGEEFAILLCNSDKRRGQAIAEELRRAVERCGCRHRNKALNLTASFGVATLVASGQTFEDLLSRADRCLYSAKRAGRNRVVVDPPKPAGGAAPGTMPAPPLMSRHPAGPGQEAQKPER
ncbi:GGDEF domain-containing protein [Salinisphaera aquimarina]|uniref:diguanylate cyclase n=1 Tax=Salinisphaera aquimarina TaxID=2094031 RepID=A0ABV7EPJ5_9GAMM